METKMKFDREYLGVTVTAQNYRDIVGPKGAETDEGRRSLRFHQKHLKSYLQGKDTFTYGWEVNEKGQKLRPQMYNVEQKISLAYEIPFTEPVYVEFESQALMRKYLKKNKL